MSVPFEILGDPKAGGILIIADHASNHVPAEIDLGIDLTRLQTHIAWDIGVADVAKRLVAAFGFAAILGGVSRLVCDLNRYADEAAVIPCNSDGIHIPGNKPNATERLDRLRRYYHSYHDMLASLLHMSRPSLILSLHSFTPQLESKPDEQRPWEVGILYNQDARAARIALPLLENANLFAGDQLPYSGLDLNATMNRHAEGNGIAYLGIEIRQDMVSDITGQERFTKILGKICQNIAEKLA